MYDIYNVDTLEKLIQMVHKMNTKSVWFERLYAGHVNKWFEMYSSSKGANYYAIHSLLYLRTIQEKYIKMYKRFVNQLKEHTCGLHMCHVCGSHYQNCYCFMLNFSVLWYFKEEYTC